MEENRSDEVTCKASYRRTANRYVWGAYALLFIALIAPGLSFIDKRPSFENIEIWFQRSGALTTILSMLANQLRDMGEKSLHVPGTFGESWKIEVLAEYGRRFLWIFWLSFIFTVAGTLVWGYGDTLYKVVVLHQR